MGVISIDSTDIESDSERPTSHGTKIDDEKKYSEILPFKFAIEHTFFFEQTRKNFTCKSIFAIFYEAHLVIRDI